MKNVPYRRNITKSRSGHYRLTLIDKEYGIRVTSLHGRNDAQHARVMDEERLSAKLTEYVNSPSVYPGDSFKE